MSQTLSSVAKEEFDSEVKHAYQGMKTLRECVTVRNNVVGDKYDFRLMGKGVATTRTGSSADVVPMNIDHSLVVATLLDYEAPEYTDVYDQATVNFSEVQELAKTIAGAMGRRDDQSIIDALATTTTTAVGNGAAALDLAAITAAAEALNKVEAPMEDRYFVTSEKGLNDLLNDATITSADYNSVRLLMSGEIDSFMGFKWKIIGSGRAEGGLPVVTTVLTSFAFHKRAIGHAIGIDMKTKVDYVPHKASWLSMGLWKAGSVCIDPEGVIPVESLA
nr:hypothetical protein 5 [bacterium]